MAIQYLKDLVWTGGDAPSTMAFWYAWKEHLKACGWTVPRSSDGLTYNPGGDQISHAGFGADGFNNNRAWIELTNGTVHLIFQVDTSTRRANRIKIGRTAFTAGAPDAITTPNTPVAADEALWKGGGTDAAPTFDQWIGSGTTMRCFVMAEDADDLGFLLVGWVNGTGPCRMLFGIVPLAPGTYDPLDTQPYICIAGAEFDVTNPATVASLSNSTADHAPKAWMNNGGSWSFVNCPAMDLRDSSGLTSVGGSGVNHVNGEDQGAPIIFIRRGTLGAPSGVKGITQWLNWALTPRSLGDRITVTTSNDHIYVPDLYVPWDGSVPTI